MKQYEKIAGLVYDRLVEKLTPQFQAITLLTFTNEYITYVERNRSKKTLELVKYVCKKLLENYSPDKILYAISLKDAEHFADILKKTAPLGVYIYLRVLCTMFNKAIEWNHIHENPFIKIKLPAKQNNKPAYVTERQLETILIHLKNDLLRDFVTIAFLTGARLSELTFLQWDDLDFKNELITIGSKNFKTKSRKQRIIPMHPKVKEILLKRYEDKKC